MDSNDRRLVSILVPCYNESESLPALFGRLNAVMDSLPCYRWEVVCVNDGSADTTLDLLTRYHNCDARWHYIDLSRNFGKEVAMLAGMDHLHGDCVVIMDADLQHPPEMIPVMLGYWTDGYDDVYAVRAADSSGGWLRRVLTRCYYAILKRTTDIPLLPGAGDFRLLDRQCIEALTSIREDHRYTKGLYCMIGFRKKAVEYSPDKRVAGESKWSFRRLLGLAADGIVSSTASPLRIATVLGALTTAVTAVVMLCNLVGGMCDGDWAEAAPSVMTVVIFMGGVQLLTIGILGEYLGRSYQQGRNRPPYFVREIDGVRVRR